MGAVRVGAVLMGAVMALGPEKVLKMNTYRAISKSIFAQLCRQLRFSDDGVGGGGVLFFNFPPPAAISVSHLVHRGGG